MASVLNFVLVLLAIIGFAWCLVGIPVGMVWGVIHLVKKGHKLDKKKWVRVTFGGLLLLTFVFALYAAFGFLTAVTGVPFTNFGMAK